jgi:hypothetical protein
MASVSLGMDIPTHWLKGHWAAQLTFRTTMFSAPQLRTLACSPEKGSNQSLLFLCQ